MNLDFFRLPVNFILELPLGWLSISLLIIGVGVTGLYLWRQRQDFRLISPHLRVWAIVALLLIIPAGMLLVLQNNELAKLPVMEFGMTRQPVMPLLSMLICMGIAYAFGSGPGMVAGLAVGLATAMLSPQYYTDLFAYMVWGAIAGASIHQAFRGDVFDVLRHPVAAGVAASSFALITSILTRFVVDSPSGDPGDMVILDYLYAAISNEYWLWMIAGIISGLILQGISSVPRFKLDIQANKSSLFSRSLRIQFTSMVIVWVFVAVLASLLIIPVTGVKIARARLITEMGRSTTAVRKELEEFNVHTRNLIKSFAADERLRYGDTDQRTDVLTNDVDLVPVFKELLFLDPNYFISAASSESARSTVLTSIEINALEKVSRNNFPQFTEYHAFPSDDGSADHGISFIAPVLADPADKSSEALGFLIGRARFDVKNSLTPIRDEGESFVVDETYRIVAHLEDEEILQTWEGMGLSTLISQHHAKSGDPGFEWVEATKHWLYYVELLDGTDQMIVHRIPYHYVLQEAGEIAGPLLLVQMGFGLLLGLVINQTSKRVTRPLKNLTEAADRMSDGNLRQPVDFKPGEDEVAHLATVFETMRSRLQERMNDLSLLLNTTQQVSATLDLEKGIPPILDAARAETGARVARMVLLTSDGRPGRVFSVGEDSSAIMRIDRALATVLSRKQSPLIVQDVEATKGIDHAKTQIKSIAAFPVRTKQRNAAMLWVGVSNLDAFDEARVNFLTTLVHQAVVLMENARLFQSVEGGRDRLAAILSSTTDAILVTDSDGNLVLSNPAARREFQLDEVKVGAPLDKLGLPQELVAAVNTQAQAVKRVRRYQMAFPETVSDAMSSDKVANGYPSVEVPLPDGRMYYASIAPIHSRSGLTMGVVIVLRDVTHFKELDEMKSEFVSTVSHDLRRPLSFMRGYTTMLTMAGELNTKQQEYAQSILEGVEQMNSLINDLLNLRRVEAGVGVRREVCRLGMVLVEAVDTMRARANTKGISLRLEPAEGAPVVMGDRTLLRQSIANLVDNAIKYTPSSGEVTVGLLVSEQHVTIRVKDTGIGIAPADQVRLFEKFYRIQRADADQVPGTGLGLALVKSIIERHDGRVWVESALDKGSTFYIELPLPRSEDLALT